MLSHAALKKLESLQKKKSKDLWWENNIPDSYDPLEIRTAQKFPKKILLNRRNLEQIIAFRTGHGDLPHTKIVLSIQTLIFIANMVHPRHKPIFFSVESYDDGVVARMGQSAHSSQKCLEHQKKL